ncbi:RNA polymerase sigma factor [Undibacterium sp. Ji83W]|uniref:RNA polymerase sigma factor n=1 Tax=Undibacterium sp. Ji83W TaxID=3413043 RepID=UPI003BF1013F
MHGSSLASIASIVSVAATAKATETAARNSYGRLVAILSARSHDVAWAEDALSTAFESALLHWPQSGIPAKPEAWLLTVARRAMIDGARQRQTQAAALPDLLLLSDELMEEMDSAESVTIPDQRLALMFACAHPAIDTSMRAPLILQTILGLDAAAIASAFLVSPATMAQRLVRAKAKIRDSGIPLLIPDQSVIGERLDAITDAIYAIYTAGWADTISTEGKRPNLADEAIWLADLLAALKPDEAESLGLLALMLYTESRRPARRDASGDYVPLAQQDTSLWDGKLIHVAEKILRRASALQQAGRYQLEAAIQSAHVARRISGQTDWPAIVRLYAQLMRITDSPVVAINHAIAVAETAGPQAALRILPTVQAQPRLQNYQAYWAARAYLLKSAGEWAQARQAYDVAIGLEPDAAVRRFLQKQRASLD